MTSSIRPNQSAPAARLRRLPGRAGFTLVELLVVMGIILVLIALIFPSLGAVWKGATRQRTAADLATIGTALEAYRQDYSDYPRLYSSGAINAENTGPAVLTAALLGAGDRTKDGQDGPGWRARLGGKIQQPYLQAEKFRLVDPVMSPSGTNVDPNIAVLGDRWGNPILYFVGNKAANPRSSTPGYVVNAPMPRADGTVSSQPTFNAGASVGYFDPTVSNGSRQRSLATGLPYFQVIMGDTSHNGVIDGTELPAYEGPYLLWSAGPDERYGPKELAAISPKNRCDDVANFTRSEY